VLKRTVVVRNEVGLHARPAAQFVEAARQFISDIRVECDGKMANAKSLLKVLSLGVKKNTEIALIAEGPDEVEAVEALHQLVESFQDLTANLSEEGAQ
jgi:phosphotransferase system HPr (HPr) family protein